jgi:hypothetical protein
VADIRFTSAHQIHYGNERTARIVDTYVVDCHILTVTKPEVRELRTEGLVLIDCRRAVEGRPEESEASEAFWIAARAASGRVAAAPPSRVMNSRRLMGFPSGRGSHPTTSLQECRVVHHSKIDCQMAEPLMAAIRV